MNKTMHTDAEVLSSNRTQTTSHSFSEENVILSLGKANTNLLFWLLQMCIKSGMVSL